MAEYRYNFSSTGGSSNQYGNCDVCGKHCTEVFLQTEERRFLLPECLSKERESKFDWTHHLCFDYFGHENCLKTKQRS